MAAVVEIRRADDPRDVIHRACQLLAEGQLVGFPTETVYTAAALATNAEGVGRLRQLVGDQAQPAGMLAVKAADEAFDYVPDMPRVGRKLIRRCWPGPVTIGFEVSQQSGLLTSLPRETRTAVANDHRVQLRMPAHELLWDVLRLLPAPLVLSPEWSAGQPLSPRANEFAAQFEHQLALVIDDGPCRYGEPSTMVRLTGESWEIATQGVVAARTLSRLSSEVYMFVCTGNTCRSPMAEGLFRKLLAEKLQCSEEDLVERGFVVLSAGLAARVGSPASPEGVQLLAAEGIDIHSHESQPLTDRLLEQVDYVYTMTRGHRDSILAERPDLADRVRLLAADGGDICDPIGGTLEDYKACKSEIERHLQAIVDSIDVR